MAGDSAIFRVTTTGDTENSVGNTEKIEFNSGAAPDATGRAVTTSFRMARDVNFHPNPRRTLNQIQDALLGVLEVTVTGYFISHNTTGGPLNFFNWQTDTATNSDFRFGRFGLRLPAFSSILSLTPSATIGYILHDIDIQDIEDPRDEVPFIAKFYRNGSI